MGIAPVLFGVFVYSSEYENKIKSVLSNTILNISLLVWIIIMYSILITIIVILFKTTHHLISIHDDQSVKINELNSKLKKADQIIDNNIKQHTKKKINGLMKKFVLNNCDVISTQLYEYTETKKGKKSIYEIKPTNYFFTQDGEVVNFVHEIYHIHASHTKKYRDVIKDYNNSSDTSIVKYIESLTKQMVKKSGNKNRVTEDSIIKYSLLTLATQCFLGVTYKNESLDQEFILELERFKRTGFLRGILHQDYYNFLHSGYSNKAKRVYITKCINFDSKEHMFVVVLNVDKTDYIDIDEYLGNIGKEFYNMLVNESDLVTSIASEKIA